jgi:FKBP-type peptidyl-prolyl cis-trans isomerase
MDSKIKTLTIFSFTILSLVFAGCTQNKWADWKVQNEAWLAQKSKESGIKKTDSGLLYKIIADPTPQAACPNMTSTIVCDYTVKLINGYKVDGGNYVSLDLNSTIPGFTEACHKIHEHGDIEFYVPAELGYDNLKYVGNDYYNAEGFGTEGTQSYIPPYSALIYTVHICSVIE